MKYPPQIMVQLIHIHGGLKGEIQEFTEPVITIGRLPSFTVHFAADEPGVSREHARIERDGNQFKLIALKDKFGTFVNGKQVRVALLRNGDVIEFGSYGPKVSFSAEFGEPLADPAQPARFGPQPAAPPLREPYRGAAASPTPPPKNDPPNLGGAGDGFPVPRGSAPLTIQFGPTIRSYRELPVVLGAHPGCDFLLQFPGIEDRHAEISFQAGGYCLKDLTGQRSVRVNGRALEAPVRLHPFDEIACAPNGPIFRFLGDGRLAEVEASQPDERGAQKPEKTDHQGRTDPQGVTPPAGFLSKLVKGFK